MKKSLLKRAIPAFILGAVLIGTSPTPAGADPEGRWKDDGNGGCYFDANDDGPNQCLPPSTPQPGRWKVDGAGGCYFDTNDSGPNQCTPSGQ